MNLTFLKHLTVLTLIFSFISQSALAQEKPKNIIYLIGDGMGPGYISAYRYYKNQVADQTLSPTLFDQYLVGTASTRPKDETWVTDSAASATALSTGIKTYNGAVAVDAEQQPLKTLFELAKEQQMRTGLAVTSSVTHATPASFYAHQKSRRQAEEIATWLIDNSFAKKGAPIVDVVLGGGEKYFNLPQRHLLNELKALGFSHVSQLPQLSEVKQPPVIGLFAENGLPSALNSSTAFLADMTTSALTLLNTDNKNGFVLLVEGSQIDWCGHANDIACTMAEMQSFENAFEVALNFAKQDKQTLVVLTADHDTGGLSVGREKKYEWHSDKVAKVKMTARAFTELNLKADYSESTTGQLIEQAWNEHIQLPLTRDELTPLVKAYADFNKAQDKQDKSLAYKQFNDHVKHVINRQTNTGWTTRGHTANDVGVFAFGPTSQIFVGHQDNTDIAKKLHSLVLAQ
ncbi:alkaline phosphatase [Catenovulum sp. SM1970]|uniref:alkaline phosphatase n=1 Tax=Marinifaba aquimaris TaxID=2741323 RepID=UPI001574256A|nr:alkaline phosphatase [Marinifaba aquimaris]NTS78428.1 alkaline phosphatase [Marinifaba aquimaris]